MIFIKLYLENDIVPSSIGRIKMKEIAMGIWLFSFAVKSQISIDPGPSVP